MAKISFQTAPKAGSGITKDVPQDVIDDMEASWTHLSANPGQEGYIACESEEELNAYLRNARIHLMRRPEGPVKIRKLKSDHLPVGHARFTLSDATQPAAEEAPAEA